MGAILYTDLMARPGADTARKINLDGDYSSFNPTAAPVATFPFLNEGDDETVWYRQRGEVAITSYAPLDMTKGYPGVANAYPFGDVNFRDGNCGIWEFDRTYGNIPRQRVRRGQSHGYAFQYITSSGVKISGAGTDSLSYEGPTYTLGTLVFVVNSTLYIDYFLEGQEESFPLLEAPQVIQIGQTIQTRGVDIDGGGFPLYLHGGCVCAAGGRNILAQDDQYIEYRGAVRGRQRREIAGPTPLFWNQNAT